MGPRETGELPLPTPLQPPPPRIPRLGGVHTTNAAGRILNHKFMVRSRSARSPPPRVIARGNVRGVTSTPRSLLFITRSPLDLALRFVRDRSITRKLLAHAAILLSHRVHCDRLVAPARLSDQLIENLIFKIGGYPLGWCPRQDYSEFAK